jgi:hypothetical protein
LWKSSIKPPACVDFRERMGMHIDIQSLPRACDPLEGTRGSGIIRCRKPGILAKTELRIPYQRPIRFLPETDYPRASRSFPRITTHAPSLSFIVISIHYSAHYMT